MKKEKKKNNVSRREFIKKITAGGITVYFGMGGIFTLAEQEPNKKKETIDYQYSTMSVSHLSEMEDWINKLKKDGKVSTNKNYLKYIGNFKFDYKKILPNAKSVIIMTMPLGVTSVIFNTKGKKYKILIPSGYVGEEGELEKKDPLKEIRDLLYKDVLKDKNKKIKYAKLPIKSLAVRSGLAKYGKNNISYVKNYGSFHSPIGFLTEEELEDNWGPFKMLRECKGCSICIKNCPTNVIKENEFVINVDKCIPLYNERLEPLPEWFEPKIIDALVGCGQCQFPCPANLDGMKKIKNIGELNEEETDFLLGAENLKEIKGKNKEMHEKIIKKLNRFTYVKYLSYFSRNLKLVLANTIPV